MSANTNSRNQYFDFLRGVAIIMVVGIHTIKVNDLGFYNFHDVVTVIIRSILNCAVPIFLAISGYFIGFKNLQFGNGHLQFLKRQIPKVYIPCLIFSLPYLAMAVWDSQSLRMGHFLWFFACGFSVYYFVALIIQCYILAPLMTKCNNLRGGGSNMLYIPSFNHCGDICH